MKNQNFFKILLSFSLVVLFTVLLFSAVSAAETPALTSFSANPYGDADDEWNEEEEARVHRVDK